jgi:hypothetical protein
MANEELAIVIASLIAWGFAMATLVLD